MTTKYLEVQVKIKEGITIDLTRVLEGTELFSELYREEEPQRKIETEEWWDILAHLLAKDEENWINLSRTKKRLKLFTRIPLYSTAVEHEQKINDLEKLLIDRSAELAITATLLNISMQAEVITTLKEEDYEPLN